MSGRPVVQQKKPRIRVALYLQCRLGDKYRMKCFWSTLYAFGRSKLRSRMFGLAWICVSPVGSLGTLAAGFWWMR